MNVKYLFAYVDLCKSIDIVASWEGLKYFYVDIVASWEGLKEYYNNNKGVY